MLLFSSHAIRGLDFRRRRLASSPTMSGDDDVRWFENYHITFHIARLLGVTLDQVRTNARGAAHGAGTFSSRPTATKNMTFQCLVRGWSGGTILSREFKHLEESGPFAGPVFNTTNPNRRPTL